MRLDPDIFERVLATYEAIGLTRGQAGLWCIPQRDARLLMEAIDPGRHRRILEIGTYVGVSTMLMALHAPQAEVHSIDPDLPLELGTPGAGVETEAVAARGAQELAAEAAARLGVADRVHLHRGGFAVGADFASRRGAMAGAAAGPSGPASPVIGAEVCRAHGPFDLAFVDGLHYADAVHADLALVGEHLAPGGAIVLHDVIGLWGGNVRWAVHRFLERHPEFVFWHEPYREIYLSVGLLQRRAEAPADAGGARRLRAPGPRLVDDAAFRSALLAAAFNDSSPTRMIELRAADVPTLRAEASGLAASFESVIVEAQDGAARRWLDALPAPIPGEIVACLGALDELDQPAAAALLHELAARERPVLFGFTPPGERGVARPFSRTLPQNTALLAAAGFAPIRDLALAFEPFLLPYWTGATRGNSHLLHMLVALPAGTAARSAARPGVFDAASFESRALGVLYRDLLTLHTMGKLPAPTAETSAAPPDERSAIDGPDDAAARLDGAAAPAPSVPPGSACAAPPTRARLASLECPRATTVVDEPPLEWTACPLCSGVQSDLVYTRPDHRHRVDGTLFRVVRCRDCGFVFVNPRPTARSIHRWYPPEFYGAGDVAEAALDRQRERLDAMAAWLSALRPGRLLDVGCYKGEFMLWMARRGWDVRGVEFSATPPNLFGLEIHHGELADAPFGIGDDAPFDAITVWAVLEHVFDPRRVLRECARRLRPGGRLFVLVPNFRSLPARFLQHDDVPRHVLMFTPETLRRLLGECGLRTRRLACEQTIYSGSVRGTLNYAAKLLAGEKHADIVAQNRAPGRWLEFACELRGRRSSFMERIDRLDQRVTPWLDRALDRVGLGFIMTAEAVRE